MEVNYLAPVRLTALALPHLKQSKGLLVAVASLAGLTGVPERSGYAASKHAMIGFFDSLRIELRGRGVDVSVVAPDFVVSEIHKRAIGPDGEPLGDSPMMQAKIMTAEDCARAHRARDREARAAGADVGAREARPLAQTTRAVADRPHRRARDPPAALGDIPDYREKGTGLARDPANEEDHPRDLSPFPGNAECPQSRPDPTCSGKWVREARPLSADREVECAPVVGK